MSRGCRISAAVLFFVQGSSLFSSACVDCLGVQSSKLNSALVDCSGGRGQSRLMKSSIFY